MKPRTIVLIGTSAIALAAIGWVTGQAAYSWLPPQASAESKLIDNLFSAMVGIGTFILLGVFLALAYSVLFFRAGRYDYTDGPAMEGNLSVEIIWTVIPFILAMGIAIYSYFIYEQMSIVGPMEHVHGSAKTAEQDPGVIQVVARQWSWEFYYPRSGVTSTELHLPNNQRAKLVLRSEDVLHGFYVPAFRIKQDIIPGRAIDFQFTPVQEGRYRLRDSQYSGTYFAAMQTDVVVESPESYRQWLEEGAKRTAKPAYNQAFEEYNRSSGSALHAGWKTVIPANPPIVNYSFTPDK
ncbi:MAG: cytochrome c oxidase subunit 2 [Chroococcopsis gigantea SAG 12.99]|jgi:cytochrome c oxidase subunit 2|nr:cytochrome c oxidase subunit II [Chlorogloea purpurea SAG 13.99]MDV2999819.1 cytochrome c oxidase subunit 2 [Chroococcopsis gigantea SAG 12.99]